MLCARPMLSPCVVCPSATGGPRHEPEQNKNENGNENGYENGYENTYQNSYQNMQQIHRTCSKHTEHAANTHLLSLDPHGTSLLRPVPPWPQIARTAVCSRRLPAQPVPWKRRQPPRAKSRAQLSGVRISNATYKSLTRATRTVNGIMQVER